MIIPYTDITSQVAPHVTGAPYESVIQALKQAATVICKNTRVWQYRQPRQRLSPGVWDYDYELPDGAAVNTIEQARINGVDAQLLTYADLQFRLPKWPDTPKDERGAPTMVADVDSQSFVVAEVPDDRLTYDLGLSLTLRPSRTAVGLPTAVMDLIEEALVEEAIYRVMILPDSPWLDTEVAAHHGKMAVYRKNEVRANAELSASGRNVRVAIPRSAFA